jgi:predicted small lipoprotein YifL
MKRNKRRIKPQLFLVAMVLLLAACGQRGPLYLPEPAPVKISEAEANETETKETEANETGDDRDKTPGTSRGPVQN